MEQFNKKQEHLIELYLLNRLDTEQQMPLERQLESDQELRNKLAYRKLIITAIQQSRKKELKHYIDENASTTLTGNFWSKGWTIFSAIIVVITGIALIILQNNSNKPETKRENSKETEQSEPVQDKFIAVPKAIEISLNELKADRIIKVYELNKEGKLIKGNKEVQIEFWTPTDTDLQGYQYYKHKLKLINVDPLNQPEVINYEGGKFLLMTGKVYPLTDANKFFLLEETKDKEILELL